ncbi:peptidase inhibitor R3HDML-like [Polypterus senegalus]|uniref:peptidase inhibitor R3HDML-like n=1 Tax=Polypterus senegalus TaxID=55291 RepID=UPI00196422D4|nr:peptidase inhibitor R3HDML-like [Polypterus senegalus]
MLAVRGPLFFPGLLIWTIQSCSSFLLPTGTVLQPHHQNSTDSLGASMDFPSVSVSKSRRKRYISSLDMAALLEYHNRVRSQVFPPAANMEYMVWDERLAKSAEAWASQCIWDHGPSQLMKFVGQNLAIYSGRYRSITELVKSWHDERHYYSYPYPQECTPSCPNKCSGSVCSHYTQMVWASSNRIGCAVNSCSNMNVWGNTWRQAVLLVCNYSIKGNWIGEAPYKMGRPCSACPPSYGGSCSNNLCFSGIKSNKVSWF